MIKSPYIMARGFKENGVKKYKAFYRGTNNIVIVKNGEELVSDSINSVYELYDIYQKKGEIVTT